VKLPGNLKNRKRKEKVKKVKKRKRREKDEEEIKKKKEKANATDRKRSGNERLKNIYTMDLGMVVIVMAHRHG
jgi:ribosomal protein S2